MPATRKSTRRSGPGVGAASNSSGKQSTLSFNHRVTKSAVVPGKSSGKDSPSGLSKEFVVVPSPTTKDEENEKDKEDIIPEVAAAPEDDVDVIPEKSEVELRAEKVTAQTIERYWGKIDGTRMAKAVHRKHGEGLTTGEKVLRYFDVSSQYGPCIGITRLKRWQRAQSLGLNPPIEVLAVLLQEEGAKDKRAHMDELLNSTAVGS